MHPSIRTMIAAMLVATAMRPAPAQDAGAAATKPEVSKAASKDGTEIAYERTGNGPALVLVASALAGRSDGARLASLLAPSFTVVNYDRRGRGDSGDTQPYSVRREIEDIEALIDANGGSAHLFGSSSGAVLALEAAGALGAKVRGLVLFEPPFVVDDSRAPIPRSVFTEIAALVDAGRRGDAVARFMTECVEVPEPMVAQMKRAPMWKGMEELAHTLRYDGELLAGLQLGDPLPKGRWKSVTVPVVVIDGGRSPKYLRNAATALAESLGARRLTLEGCDHSVPYMAPQVLVRPIVELAGSAPDAEAKGASGEVRGG